MTEFRKQVEDRKVFIRRYLEEHDDQFGSIDELIEYAEAEAMPYLTEKAEQMLVEDAYREMIEGFDAWSLAAREVKYGL